MEQTITSIAMAISLALGAVLGVLSAGSALADLNGDRRVDVLDLQALAGRSPAEAAPEGDVNRDGVVDVLDLQRVLGEEAPSEGPAPHEEGPPQLWATLPATAHPVSTPCLTFFTVLPGLADAPNPAACVASFEEAAVSGSLPRRFLGELSPHAPPLAA